MSGYQTMLPVHQREQRYRKQKVTRKQAWLAYMVPSIACTRREELQQESAKSYRPKNLDGVYAIKPDVHRKIAMFCALKQGEGLFL